MYVYTAAVLWHKEIVIVKPNSLCTVVASWKQCVSMTVTADILFYLPKLIMHSNK